MKKKIFEMDVEETDPETATEEQTAEEPKAEEPEASEVETAETAEPESETVDTEPESAEAEPETEATETETKNLTTEGNMTKTDKKILEHLKPYSALSDTYFCSIYFKNKDRFMYSVFDKLKTWTEKNGGKIQKLSDKMIIGEKKGFIVRIIFPCHGKRDMKNIMSLLYTESVTTADYLPEIESETVTESTETETTEEAKIESTTTTVTETIETETSTETKQEITTEIESAEETAKKTENAINMMLYGIPKTKFLPTEIFGADEESDNMEKIINFDKFAKALIKAVGLEKTKEVRYTVQGVNVFFEYNGNMYKCYTPQSKLYKLSGQRFNLITWKDLKKDSYEKSDDNSGSLYTARSPPESSLLNLTRKNKLIKREDF